MQTCPYEHQNPEVNALAPMVKGPFFNILLLSKFLKDPIAFFLDCVKRYGKIFRVQFFNQQFTVIASNEGFDFLKNQNQGGEFFSSGRFWLDLLDAWNAKQTIVNMDGPQHAKMRKLIKPFTSKEQIMDVSPILLTVSKAQLSNLKVKQHVSVKKMTSEWMCHVIYSTFNKSPSTLDKAFVKTLLSWQKETFKMYAGKTKPLFLRHLPIYKHKDKKVWHFINELKAKRQQNPKPDAFSQILQMANDNPELFTTEGDIDFMLIHTMISTDNLSNMLSFLIYELTKNKLLLAELCQGLDELVQEHHGTIPCPLTIKNCLPDLYNLCLETFRLYPNVPAINRKVEKSFTLDGYRIPQGTDVLFFTSVNHFNSNYYPQPAHFDIKRFTSPRNEHLQKHAYLPFGLGAHMCTAVAFSELLLLKVAAIFLYYIDFEAINPETTYNKTFTPFIGINPKFKIQIKRFRHKI